MAAVTVSLIVGVLGPCAADEADEAKKSLEPPKQIKCEEIHDGAERAQCLIDRNTTPGGGVRAYQPGVLAKPDQL